ncbi:MAG TPA: nuclear transport factor 2 family protein [Pyrinomonadaceae bacterium]|nr:nuclear transport factor 2 family protein [Pyrinomonadaceae bacterium]
MAAAASTIWAQSEKKTTQGSKLIESQLIELERELSDALVKQDRVVLDRLWSDDLVFTFPKGKVSRKAERLAEQQASRPSTQSKVSNDVVKIFPHGNTAIVTVLSTWREIHGTQEFSEKYQATHIWIKQKGRWQLVAAHVSQVPK